MKLLILCDEGNNRSVTLAHLLKYEGHDVITGGLNRNSHETIKLLCDWADIVITTAVDQILPINRKSLLVDLGPDIYPRPFNKDLLNIARTALKGVTLE